MSDSKEQYVEQVLKVMTELGGRLFPPVQEAEFDRTAQADIAADKNRCEMHPELVTLERLYPIGAWICRECAQTMWKTGGFPAGLLVVNMADRPENWKPE